MPKSRNALYGRSASEVMKKKKKKKKKKLLTERMGQTYPEVVQPWKRKQDLKATPVLRFAIHMPSTLHRDNFLATVPLKDEREERKANRLAMTAVETPSRSKIKPKGQRDHYMLSVSHDIRM